MQFHKLKYNKSDDCANTPSIKQEQAAPKELHVHVRRFAWAYQKNPVRNTCAPLIQNPTTLGAHGLWLRNYFSCYARNNAFGCGF